MSIGELDAKVRELRFLREMAEQISRKIDIVEDSIDGEMDRQHTEELAGQDWLCTRKIEQRRHVNIKGLRQEAPELVARFVTTYTSRQIYVV